MSGRRETLRCLVTLIALVFHEGRPVQFVEGMEPLRGAYPALFRLPKNRYVAWQQVGRIRNEGVAGGSLEDAMSVFRREFGIDLKELQELYERREWVGSKYGGARCARITAMFVMHTRVLVQEMLIRRKDCWGTC